MAEGQQLVTLNKWYWGMTSDEYLGGHFYYWENIDIRSNSKAFKLSKRIVENIINYRSTGYHNKLIPNKLEVLWFSQDWRIEGSSRHKDTAPISLSRWWYLYNRGWWAYINAISFGNYLIWVTSTKLDAFEIDTDQEYGLWLWWGQLLDTPSLSENTWWTVWTWWTTWAWGAVHTAGNTESLLQTITPWAWKWRISIYIKNWTAGYLNVKYDWSVVETIEIETGKVSTKRYTYNVTTSDSDAVELIPSTDFDGTVAYVKVYQYDDTKIDAGITLESSAKKPLLHDWWTLYIGSWNKIQTVDTTLTFGSWTVEDWLTLNEWDLIVWLTKIGNIIYIYATNGNDWIKYMWNGVDGAPNEKTIWKNKPFISVDGDWNQDYVICGSTYKRDFYVTIWYEKQLISQSKYLSNYDDSWEYNAYRLSNRFDVKDIIWFYWDTVWLWCYGWLYTYGTYLPWLSPSMIKEYASNDTTYIERVLSMAMFNSMPYISYQSLSNNIIARVEQTQHNKQWYMLTSPIIWENLSEEKELSKMRIWYYLPSSLTSIKIYAMANDKYFHRFYVSGVTTEPSMWDTYTNYSNNEFTVIDTDLTAWVWTITFTSEIPYDWTVNWNEWILTKLNWDWQTSIDYTDYDNYCLIKTITTDKYKYGNEYIFSQSFIDSHLPVLHKIQFKIELLTTENNLSPEIYDIPVLTNIVKDGL